MAVSKLFLLCLASVLVLAASGPTHHVVRIHRTSDLSESVNDFAVKFHKVAAENGGDANVIASPFAIQLLLSLYATGTEGPLRQELIDSLHLGDFQQIVERFGSVSRQFSSYNPDILTVANRMYTPPNAAANVSLLNQDFYQASRAYNAEVQELNFTDTARAVSTINQWVAEKTHQHIKEAVSSSDIPADTALALLNVIYFQGKWNVPFKAENTKEEDFFVKKETPVKKQMMQLDRPFRYHDSEQLGARLLELPYQEDGFRMVVVLPKEVDGLHSVLEKLSQHGLKRSLNRLLPYPALILLKFPKFEIESKLDLNLLLPKVGVSKLFTEPATKLLARQTVVVEKALQKAFVKVDEEGATAGAFTGVYATAYSALVSPPPQPIQFHVDRPFFFAILHDDTVLFTGTYVQ